MRDNSHNILGSPFLVREGGQGVGLLAPLITWMQGPARYFLLAASCKNAVRLSI